MNAIDLKNQAASAKRTSTALEQLARRLTLSDADSKVLVRAAAILATQGSKVTREAAATKLKEAAQERAIAAATVEVKRIIAAWPAETLLDKIAIICANRFGLNNLRDYLVTKRPDELAWYIDSMLQTALWDIVSDAAYRSVVDGKPVVDIMAHAREQLEKYRTSRSTMDFVEQYQKLRISK